MNRRNYLKSLVVVGGLGISSFSITKWIGSVGTIRPDKIAELVHKKALISELADTIIPATDTPGAKEAGVGDYIVSVMLNCADQREQQKFITGINDLEEYSTNEYGKTFLECDATVKHAILEYFSTSFVPRSRIVRKIEMKIFGQSFYSKLRELTVEGYCVSRLGATQGLSYDYVPGAYAACIPLSPLQKSWATK
jgi:hypothetical protein